MRHARFPKAIFFSARETCQVSQADIFGKSDDHVRFFVCSNVDRRKDVTVFFYVDVA